MNHTLDKVTEPGADKLAPLHVGNVSKIFMKRLRRLGITVLAMTLLVSRFNNEDGVFSHRAVARFKH